MGSGVTEAVVFGSRDALSDALAAGGNPDETEKGVTALTLACIQNREDLVSELLDTTPISRHETLMEPPCCTRLPVSEAVQSSGCSWIAERTKNRVRASAKRPSWRRPTRATKKQSARC